MAKSKPARGITISPQSQSAKQARLLVEAGEFKSVEQAVQHGLQLATKERYLKLAYLEQLRSAVAEGLADIAAGRVSEFDDDAMRRIIARGKQKLTARRRVSAGRKAS